MVIASRLYPTNLDRSADSFEISILISASAEDHSSRRPACRSDTVLSSALVTVFSPDGSGLCPLHTAKQFCSLRWLCRLDLS
jgi:hypothetical protein